MLPGPALVVLPSRELQVLPGHALVLLARVPQEERRMEGRDQDGGAVRVHAPAQAADRFLGAEEALRGDAPEGEDDLGLERGELGREHRRARRELLGLRVPVAGRSALDCIRNIHLVAREADARRLEHLGEELARAPDERQALRVLVGARPLADHDELCARAARAEDDRRAPLAELALPAALERPLLGAQRLVGTEEVLALEAELGRAEVAMVTERGAERAQRVGERLAGIGGRVGRGYRATFLAPAPARSARTWVRIASATSAFVIRGSGLWPPQRSRSSTSFSSASKPMPFWLTSFATSRSMPLRSSFSRAFAATSLVSAAKPTMNAPVWRAATSARMSGFGVSSRVRSRLPLILTGAACRAR